MTFLVYEGGEWRKETRAEVMRREDLEGKCPCDVCWKEARDHGVYVWPLLPEAREKLKRCESCGRVIPSKSEDED